MEGRNRKMKSGSLVLENKRAMLSEIKDKIQRSSVMIFCDYRGTSVDKLTQIRTRLKKANAEVKVYKNTLTEKALQEYNINFSEKMLKDPTIIFSTISDPVELTKIVKKFTDDIETIKIKGGVLEKSHIQKEQVLELSQLPGKNELIAKVLQGMNSPISNLVGSLSSPIRGLVCVLNSIKVKKEEA